MRHLLPIAILSISLLNSCGEAPSATQKSAAPLPPKASTPTRAIASIPPPPSATRATTAPFQAPLPQPIIIIAGGFRSCPLLKVSPRFTMRDILDAQIRLLASRVPGVRPMFFHTCFGHDKSQVRLISFDEPGTIQILNTEDYLDMLYTRVARLERPVVYITGHSYGGWLSMLMSLHFPARVDVRVLNTFDAISPATCRPQTFLDSIFTSPEYKQGRAVPGCNEAPMDFLPYDRQAVAERTQIWNNFFQTGFSLLHSSPIPEADLNLHGPECGPGAHSRITENPGFIELSARAVADDFVGLLRSRH
jgi:pimeloyl-ACP methyl ester carboxylesterase